MGAPIFLKLLNYKITQLPISLFVFCDSVVQSRLFVRRVSNTSHSRNKTQQDYREYLTVDIINALRYARTCDQEFRQ